MTMIPVPDDFPWDISPASLTGAQPKLAARLVDGKVVAGLTPQERRERWELCEDLAQQLAPKARHDAERHPHHSREMTLQRIRTAVAVRQWVSVVELTWLLARLRTLLGW